MIPLSLALVFALALGLFVRAVWLGYPPVTFRAEVLSAREQTIVAAAADALFPGGGPIPVSGTEAGLVAYVDDNLARLGPRARLLVRLLLVLVEHGPWLFGGAPHRFSRLPLEQRLAELRRMATSRLYFRRVSFLSLRALLSMGYLANPEVAGRIGLEPNRAPFERPSARLSEVLA